MRSVRRRKLLVLICLAAALAAAHWCRLHVRPYYTTVAVLKLSPAQPARPGFTAAGVDAAAQVDQVCDYTVIGSAVRSAPVRETALIRSQRNPIEFVRSHLKVTAGGPGEIRLSLLSDKPDDARIVIDSVAAAYARSALAIDLEPVRSPAPVSMAEPASRPLSITPATPEVRRQLTQDRARVGAALAAAGTDAVRADRLYKDAVDFFGSDAALRAAAATDSRETPSESELTLMHDDLVQLREAAIKSDSNPAGKKPTDPDFNRLCASYAGGVSKLSHRSHDAVQKLQSRFDLLADQEPKLDAADDASARSKDQVASATQSYSPENLPTTVAAAVTPVTTGLQVTVQTPATIDWDAPLPSRVQLYTAAVLIGLLAGIVLARLRDGISPRLHGPLESAGVARSRWLGSVPPLPRTLSTPALRGQSVLVEPSGKITAGWNRVAACLNVEFVDRFDRIILFTAPGKSRGKSLAASNTAIAMARAGNRVVIVDGHGNRPAVGEIFGDTLDQNPRPGNSTAQSTGLADVLRGRVQLDAALKPTGMPMLEVLTCGSGPAARAAELNTPDFGHLLDQLCERFDRVVVDAGPSETAECAVLAAYSDVAVLIADRRAGRRRQLRAAATAVRSVGSRLAGVVWTCSPWRFRQVATAASKPDSGTSVDVTVMSVSDRGPGITNGPEGQNRSASSDPGQMPTRVSADKSETGTEDQAPPTFSPS